ncbi:MAG: hypothetical protein K2N25_03335, partial [Muribaculaceae bacterium]|nr:hypothetical protein [Muribaculaceae bacterium]
IAMMLAGVLVGNWQESVSIGVCGGLGIWWIAQLVNTKKHRDIQFDWRRSWMLFGYIVGTATNCLAPSTMSRISDMAMPLTDRLLIASYSFPAIILLIICIIYAAHKHGKPHLFSFKRKDDELPQGVLFWGMIILILFNFVIGVYSNRQLFGANLFAAILTLIILPRHRFGWIINTIASLAVIAFWSIMLLGIFEVRRQYDDIAALHSESKDGSVYYDRTRVMTLGFPLRAKYYEDILGQFDNDLHHSMMKDFKHVRKGKTLKLKPTNAIKEESFERYAKGHFTVTLKEPPKGEAPREIIVFGHYPAGIKGSPRKISVTKYSNRSKSFSSVVIIPEFPFFATDSIAIIPEN